MRTFTDRQKFLVVFSLVIVALFLAAHPLQVQYVTATVPAGTYP
jgi:hypothetical protein